MAEHPHADDPTIADNSALWRRILPEWAVHDENRGSLRVSSAAFDNSKDGTPTSVHLAQVASELGRGPADILRRYASYGLAALTAGEARACGQLVGRDPLPDDPTHGYIAGPKPRSVKKRLAAAAVWVITPPHR